MLKAFCIVKQPECEENLNRTFIYSKMIYNTKLKCIALLMDSYNRKWFVAVKFHFVQEMISVIRLLSDEILDANFYTTIKSGLNDQKS